MTRHLNTTILFKYTNSFSIGNCSPFVLLFFLSPPQSNPRGFAGRMSTEDQLYEGEVAYDDSAALPAPVVEGTPFVFKQRENTFFPPVRRILGL